MSDVTRPTEIADTRSDQERLEVRYPNPEARPREELEHLERVWAPPRGLAMITEVNNSFIGILYVGTAFLFFVLAGILALLIRAQLAVPGNDLIGHELYNQLFTMHGTMMMFLFAVPAVEAMAVYLLPNMLGARDLPFPRLSAYAYWAYLFGGLMFFASLFFGLAPNGGWFMYPPLTSMEYSPQINTDFWLLGIGFIEISAIAGAIEIVVGIFKTRAPGMTLDKLPVYAWAMLVFAGMIIFGFPAVILGTALLEIERAFDWPFFIAERGGDPLLWQHLFWFFGHPEVYIIFLPAAGMVSMIVPTMVQSPLVGYRLVVLAILATGFLSFGLWVHHMYTTGIPGSSLSFFSAASMAVAIPSGIQVFAWIATIASGKLRFDTPSLFILGFLFIFTLGGLTGVMVAMVPFDFQVHDTYFIVAHFHYVLIGGMVFPLFAAFYYWMPTASARPMSERIGKWVFWLLFIGVNGTFFGMHIMGLAGLPRRVYTYPAEMNLGALNMISSLGALVVAAAVALFIIDLIRNFRPFTGHNSGNVWRAGTLEWLPSGNYQTRSIPIVASREPIWSDQRLPEDVVAGRYYLPGPMTGTRETLITTPMDARPQYLLKLPGPNWASLLAALFTALFFMGLTVKLYMPSLACGVLAVAMVLWWLWRSDPPLEHEEVEIGGGFTIPVNADGPASHSWWGVSSFLAVGATLFLCLVFSYLYLWLVNLEAWIPAGTTLPPVLQFVGSLGLYGAGAVLLVLAGRGIPAQKGGSSLKLWTLLPLGLLLTGAAWAIELLGHRATGLDPSASSYGAAVYMISVIQGVYVAVLVLMTAFTLVRSFTGALYGRRRSSYDSTRLLWLYTSIQGAIGLVLVHEFPRAVGLI